MPRFFKFALILVLSVTSLSARLLAQVDAGQITGTISDASGAVLGGATVTAVNAANGAMRDVKTSGNGEYTLSALPPGTYAITVDSKGFSKATQSIIVAVGSANHLDVKMGVESQNIQVTVAADNLAGINLENNEVSQVIDSKQIASLPSLERDPYDFAQISGFATTDSSAAARGVDGLNFSGARSSSTDILLDGMENTDVYAVGVAQTIPLEAVSEYRVVTAGMGVQYGRASGGVVNVVTTSGGNKFHGTASDYNRISEFASNGFNNNALHAAGDLANPKSRFVRNQFGYSVGGPIFRDKLFFFSTTEWLRIRSNASVVAEVAMPQLIAASAPATQAFFGAYGKLAQPVNGQIFTLGYLADPGNGQPLQTDAAAIVAANPALAATPAFGTVVYQNPGDSGAGLPQNTYYTFNRVDYTLSDKTSVFGSYALYDGTIASGTNNTSPYAGYNTGSTNYDNRGMGSLTHIFSPALSSNTRVMFSRLNNAQPLGTNPVSPTLYVNGSSALTLGPGTVYFPGYSATAPGNAIPFGGPQNEGQITEDVSWTLGKHTLDIGGLYLYIKDNRSFGAYEEAVEGLKQSGSTGALTNFVNGNLGLFQVALDPQGKYPCVRNVADGSYNVTSACNLSLPISSPSFSRSNRYHDGAAYIADTWKATPRLTLNAGLRWEIYGPQHSTHPNLDSNFFLGKTGDIFDRIRAGGLQTRETAPNGRLWDLNLKQFGPRVGFAYDLTGDGKTSVRGGFGLAYERNFNNVTFNVIQNPPNYAVVSFTPADLTAGQTLNISTNNLGQFGTGTGTKFLSNTTLRAVDPDIKAAYNEFYTLAVQRTVSSNTSVSVTYTGERGIHNYSIANINRSYSGGIYQGDANLTNRLNLQYSNINFRGADGDSFYNGLNVGVVSSNFMHQGLTATANYTYAHSLDNTSSTFTDGASNANNLGYLDPFNHALDHGNSDFDIRHRIATGLVWEIPFAKNLRGIENRLLDGFEASTIFSASTGAPFTMFDCSDAVTSCPRAMPLVPVDHHRTGNMTDLTSTFGPNTYSYIHLPAYTPANYLQYADNLTGSGDEPNCSGPRGAGCVWPSSMQSRNSFSGPGQWSLDADVLKNIKVREGMSIQLRGEAYNLLNHANTFLNLGGASDVSSFTDVLAYKSGNRRLQLAGKFVF